jgi:hypothetical protein
MLNDLKDLEKAIKLCRKLGVSSIKIGDVEFHLGSLEVNANKRVTASSKLLSTAAPVGEIDEHTRIDISDELTEDQMLFYSSEPSLMDTQ